MGEKEKVITIMKLKVDLQCSKCYKKVKKVLCKFPQIRDTVYDEKNNIVTIKVVCCNPEKLRDKICCKGCGVIKSIEILEPPPPPKPKPKEQQPEKLKELPPPPPAPKPEKLKELPPPPPAPKPEPPKEPAKPPHIPGPPPSIPVCPRVVPIGVCCGSCYEGRGGGPCFQGYGGPPQVSCYDGYYGRPIYDSYGCGGPCYLSRCDEYLYEENASACTIM